MTTLPDSSLALHAAASLAAANISIAGPDSALLRLVLEFETLTGFYMASFDAIEDDDVRSQYQAGLDVRMNEIKGEVWQNKPQTLAGFKALGRAVCNYSPDILKSEHLVDAGHLDASLVNVLLLALAA